MSRFLKLALLASTMASPLAAEPLGLGRTATPEEVSVWDIDVRPDGLGLPEGSGDVMTGDGIYTEKCSACHGVFGEGTGRWPVLAGGQGSLSNARPVKTIGSYWPYLSTVYDYINRAMPFGDAQSLTDDEVYAITAYLLYLNNEVDEDFVLSSDNFNEARLPNEDGFKPDDREEVEFAAFKEEPCMTDCKPSVEITMRAAVLDVTPEETAAKEAAAKAEAETAAPATEEAASETTTPEEAPAPEAAPEAAPVEVAEAPAADPALIKAGEKAFRKCKSCHQIGAKAKNRVGPVLNGIVDGPAGAVEGFRYSKAMEAAAEDGLVWSHDALTSFLGDPKGYMKGTKMSFPGVRKEEDIEALIAYLRDASE
ncbi:Cytochrome c2 [Sulfitobacter indolifex]|uniref:Diheme cytochrome c SoxD n=1 Tax=Sulfitobacter indolifex HEL-45 TaxID=391624 RepID=A0ABP2D7M5_9RHOB|nr:c-type cytochrome [Sulfitobacter indolifex]EDQ04239.1 diheme cytochrome c SoxD [Sulfitobacter indolifex HEL-45]UOA19091.1 Cytochrome c2 [Sulfitobacter indolifex]